LGQGCDAGVFVVVLNSQQICSNRIAHPVRLFPGGLLIKKTEQEINLFPIILILNNASHVEKDEILRCFWKIGTFFHIQQPIFRSQRNLQIND